MKDPKEIAAGILARGKAQSEREGGGVLCVGCHIGYMSPTCPTHGPMKEAHDRACADHTARAMAHESVTELCAKHGNSGEYIAQLERERDQAVARAEKYCLELGQMQTERDELRAALERCATAAGGHVAQVCTHRFHCLIAEEVELVTDSLRAQLAAAVGKLRDCIDPMKAAAALMVTNGTCHGGGYWTYRALEEVTLQVEQFIAAHQRDGGKA